MFDSRGRERFYTKGHSNKIIIEKNNLIHLYIEQMLSMQKIQKILNRHQCVIVYNLKKHGIKIRKPHEYNIGAKREKSTCLKISKANKGVKKKFTEESRAAISEWRSKNYKGNKNHFYGKKHTQETKDKISKAKVGKCGGENHPLWRGGTSKEPYSFDFNNELKALIRKRDNHKCQMCSAPQEEYSKTFHVHHKDYDKKNSSPNNLITLCPSCHSKTVHKPEIYKEYFNVQ